MRIWEKNMVEENKRLPCEYENMGKKEWEDEMCEQVKTKKKKKQNMEENEQRTKKYVPFGVVEYIDGNGFAKRSDWDLYRRQRQSE